jgi:hypothetical protein
MAINKLERQVLEMIGEDANSPDVFTDDASGIEQIRQSLADGIAETVGLVGGWVETFSVPLVVDQTFYRIELLDADIGWFSDVWNVDTQTRLNQASLITLNSWDPLWMRYTGPPTQYVPIGTNTIAICPKASSSSGILELHIAAIPHVYKTGTDRIKLKRTYERAVVDYAVGEYWASRGAAAEATAHMSRFAEALGLQRTDRGNTGRIYSFDRVKESPDDIRISP